MKKNLIIQAITIILIISTLIFFIPTISKASIIGDAFENGDGFLQTQPDQTIQDMVDDTKIIKTSKDIYNLLMIIAIVVASIVVLVLGIQFMAGSVEQKAKVKEMLMPFGIGCVVIFGSLAIWRIVISVMSSIM